MHTFVDFDDFGTIGSKDFSLNFTPTENKGVGSHCTSLLFIYEKYRSGKSIPYNVIYHIFAQSFSS